MKAPRGLPAEARRGKRVTWLVAGLGLLVLVAAIFAARRGLMEQWYLSQLRSGRDWRVTAERLGQLRSVEGIAFLLQELAVLNPVELGIPVTPRGWSEADLDHESGCMFALGSMAEEMGPEHFESCLVEILSDRSRAPGGRAEAARFLALGARRQPMKLEGEPTLREPVGAPGPPADARALSVLRKHLEDVDPIVRAAAARALELLQGSGEVK